MWYAAQEVMHGSLGEHNAPAIFGTKRLYTDKWQRRNRTLSSSESDIDHNRNKALRGNVYT